MLEAGARPDEGDEAGCADGPLPSISCVGAGDCVAAGFYTGRAGGTEFMISNQSGGRWGEIHAGHAAS